MFYTHLKNRLYHITCQTLFYGTKMEKTMPLTPLEVFCSNPDRYDGVTVDTHEIRLSNDDFRNKLMVSLVQWNILGKKAVWFKIPLAQANYVPLLAKEGFEYHHARKDYVMMTKWLKRTPNSLPPYPFTFIGIAGLTVNDQNEVLVIQEKYDVEKKWKFPGGYANPGEDFGETAKREVWEETGIKTKFMSILAMRHHHKSQFGCSDLYIVCLLKPLTFDIKQCQYEISDCKWMKIEELKKHGQVTKQNLLFLEAYENGNVHKLTIGESQCFSKFIKANQNVYFIK